MQEIKSILNGAIVLETRRHVDDRGVFAVPFEADQAEELGLPRVFVQDNHSVSDRTGTLRGIHLQLPPFEQGKLVRVLRGRVADVIVDLRPGSPTHGEHEIIELSAEADHQLWVPKGFGHSFCTLEADTEVFYKVDAPYCRDAERTLAWNDPDIGIDWPFRAADVTLSEKDTMGRSFAEIAGELAEVSAE